MAYDYDESEGGRGPQAMLQPITDGIRQFGLSKLVLIALVLVAAYVYLFVIPRPAGLTVMAVELDREDLVLSDAEVIITSEGATVGGGYHRPRR